MGNCIRTSDKNVPRTAQLLTISYWISYHFFNSDTTVMADPDEEEDIPSITDAFEQVEHEISLAGRTMEVLRIVVESGPVCITEISNQLGHPNNEIRYSLRVLEEENLIEPTAEGAAPTDGAASSFEEWNTRIDQVKSQLRSRANEFGTDESDPVETADSGTDGATDTTAESDDETDDVRGSETGEPSAEQTGQEAGTAEVTLPGEPAAETAPSDDATTSSVGDASSTASGGTEQSEDSGTVADAQSQDEASETNRESYRQKIPEPERASQALPLSLEYSDIESGPVIGRGGNATVREGTVAVDGESHTVAVKEPATEGTQTGDDIAAFEREARRWDRLSNRGHVVGVVDWDVDPLPWMALEYMDGGSLATRVDECSLHQALWICERVASAVRHDQTGMAHLDLKPANILFESTDDDNWDIPKVADWGIAQLLNEHSATAGGMTATYAAPEQFDPDTYDSPDSKTDIYQLGVVLYELLVGEPPFTGSDVNVMQSVLSDEPRLPGDRVTGIPPEVDGTVAKALATEPADRFETMERFQSRLQAHLEEI